jgi:hypothetical protein
MIATFKDDNPNQNDSKREFSVSIDYPKFGSNFLESFNEYLSQGKLKKEKFVEFLKGNIAQAYKTEYFFELVDKREEWMYLKNKQTHPWKNPLLYAMYKKCQDEPFNHSEVS